MIDYYPLLDNEWVLVPQPVRIGPGVAVRVSGIQGSAALLFSVPGKDSAVRP